MQRPIVIKIGGSTLGNHDTTLQDLVTLQKRQVPMVVVHGGASRVTEWLKRHGCETSFLDGVRVTDGDSLEMVAAVLGGLVNTELVADIIALGGMAMGMTGVDGNLLECRITNPAIGFAGKIAKVNPAGVEILLQSGFIPVIGPPGAKAPDESVEVPYININGDEIAGKLAEALDAESLIFLTDVAGILDSDGKLLEQLSAEQVKGLMNSGVISRGMIPKSESAIFALGKVSSTKIIDGRSAHALLEAVEGKPGGTVITA